MQQEIRALTGVRAIAAFSILFLHFRSYHYDETSILRCLHGFTGNFVDGVMVFFLLSGFILSYVHQKDFDVSISFSKYFNFIWLRIARVYPVHICTLLALFLMFYSRHIIEGNLYTFFLNVFLIQAWGFTPTYSWNGPAWSVSAEWFAYLLFPLLVFFNKKIKVIGSFILILAYLYLLYFYFPALMPPQNKVFLHGILLLRFFILFCIGVCLFNIYQKLKNGIHYEFFFLISISYLIASPYFHLHNLGPISAIILILSLTKSKLGELLIGNSLMVYLGKISFSLYMIHIPYFLAIRYLIRAGLIKPLPFWLFLVLVTCAASITYHLLESPARKWMRSLHAKFFISIPKLQNVT